MNPERLPVGIQDFDRLRSTNSYYVDKTPLIKDLIHRGDHWFLSRPRRFGKSLLLDTLKALFEAREDLFSGLAIYDNWDWSIRHPVVRLSFGGKYEEPRDVEQSILAQLKIIERRADLSAATWQTAPEYLFDLLDRLHHTTEQRAVILIDEYDKPIIDHLSAPKVAHANREYLRRIYGVIKDSAEHLRFVFVTGISMFSKVSLFSDLNNLEDISLDPHFATICGYTDADIDTVFAPELDGLDRDAIRAWYNGYNWLGEERLYNPFDVLLLLRSRRFKPYWFRTGSPRFLFETLKAKSMNTLDLEGCISDEALISKFEIDDISAEALLFQTGYLTITEERSDGHDIMYRLDYPNQEVQFSLNRELLNYFGKSVTEAVDQGRELRKLLEANDFKGFADKFRTYLSSIPYQWTTTGNLARYEAWYAGLLHMGFRATGVDVRSEESSSHGRADMVVLTGGQVFVLEFKMVESAKETESALETALAQMRDRRYAEKYRDRKEPIHQIAIVCDRKDRVLRDIRVESLG
ncbi:MAG: AAA family ATPase [Aestuariivita sp.]|nr:AAA family ATPase [Aestuariivita sp.]MCY4202485.1 AAA family ATPase [Aestuariivita sp.]